MSQVLMELQEVHPAIQAAQQAVKTSPVWWVAYQTLGRALLSVGEVQLVSVQKPKYGIQPPNL